MEGGIYIFFAIVLIDPQRAQNIDGIGCRMKQATGQVEKRRNEIESRGEGDKVRADSEKETGESETREKGGRGEVYGSLCNGIHCKGVTAEKHVTETLGVLDCRSSERKSKRE